MLQDGYDSSCPLRQASGSVEMDGRTLRLEGSRQLRNQLMADDLLHVSLVHVKRVDSFCVDGLSVGEGCAEAPVCFCSSAIRYQYHRHVSVCCV